MVEIKTPTTPVKAQKTEIITANSNAIVNIQGSSKLQVTPADYVIAQSTYNGNVPKGISQWIQDEISRSIAGGDIFGVLENIRTTLMDSIELGVNQYIETLQTDYVSQSSLITTLGSAIGATEAKILDVQQTFATENEAFATEITGLRARLGDDGSPGAIEAFIGNIALTRVTPEFASATDANTLFVSYNDLEERYSQIDVRLESNDFLMAGHFPEWDGIVTPEVGMYKVINGIHYTYVEGTLGEFADGWMRSTEAPYAYTDNAAANARNGVLHNAVLASPPTATGMNDIWVVTDRWYNDSGTVVTTSGPTGQLGKYKNLVKVWNGSTWVQQTLAQTQSLGVLWVGGASKLLYGPDGGVTGWEFADGSGLQSEFKVNAQKFSVSDGTTGYTPFSIVGNNIQFNGVVSFTNVTGAPAIPDSVSDLVNDSGYTTLPAVAAQGYVLPAGVANAINTNTTTINGSKITTGTIAAGQIAAGAITSNHIAANTITANKISSYNLTATNATIQNGMFGTLAIAGNAVTVPSSYFGAHNTRGTGKDNWFDIGEITIDLGYNNTHPVFVAADIGQGWDGSGWWYMRILAKHQLDGTWSKVSLKGGTTRVDTATSFYSHSPTGLCRYKLQWSSDGGAILFSSALYVIGTKR